MDNLCSRRLDEVLEALQAAENLRRTNPDAARNLAAKAVADYDALRPQLDALQRYREENANDDEVRGRGLSAFGSTAHQNEAAELRDQLRPFVQESGKPEKPKPEITIPEYGMDLDKPETPPQPLPKPSQREDAARRAQRGEDQLAQQPAPDPAQSSRVAKDYLRGNRPDGASRVLDRLIENDGADGEAYRLRSAARFQQQDWAGSYADAQRALQLDPNDTVAANLLGTARMQLNRLGLEPPKLKPGEGRKGEEGGAEPGAAGPRLTGSEVAMPSSGAPPALDSRSALLAAIERRIHIGDRNGALLTLTRFLDRYPEDPRALGLRAYLLNRAKNPAAALIDAQRALLLAPDDPAALRERAYALVQLGRYQEGLESAERAIRLQPRNGLGYLYRAMALQGLGRREEALKDFALAAQLDPSLRSFYDSALAEAPGGAKKAVGGLSRGRLRALIALVAAPLLLFGLWGGWRRFAGLTSRPADLEPVVPESPETLAVGGLLGGTYRIGRELGRGGMGVVFEAWDLGLERRVAVKQLHTPDGAPEDYRRFLQEARLVAKLSHPNIVQIHALVEDRGLHYLVFELVEGRGLDAVLAERGRLPPEEARAVLAGVCPALDCAHEARIIHRDLKPANIMATAQGTYKVMDFGIAHQSRGAAPLTRTGAWGTPPYMAPEQEEGLVSRESDLYALGCTAYELLAGARPFATTAEKLAPRFAPLSRLGLPPALDAFMARALAPDPARRFHSGAELLAAYDACLTGRIAA